MRGRRLQGFKRKLAGLCAAGMLFQSVQCGITREELLPGLIQTVGSVLISSYVNDLFNVTQSPF